jgi:hypothetical protein
VLVAWYFRIYRFLHNSSSNLVIAEAKRRYSASREVAGSSSGFFN